MSDNSIRRGFRFPANSDGLTEQADPSQRRFSAGGCARDACAELEGAQDESNLVEILPRAGGAVNLSGNLSMTRSHSYFPSGSMDQPALAAEASRRGVDGSGDTNATNGNGSGSRSRRQKGVHNSPLFTSAAYGGAQPALSFIASVRDRESDCQSASVGSPKEEEDAPAMNMDASINPRMRASAIRRRAQNKAHQNPNMTLHGGGGSGRTTPVSSSTTHLTAYRGNGIEEALTNLEDQDQVLVSPRGGSFAAGTARLSQRPSINEQSGSESIGVSNAEMARYFSLYLTPNEKLRRDSAQFNSEASCTQVPQPRKSLGPPLMGELSPNAGSHRAKSSENDIVQQVVDLQKRVSLLEGQNRSLHVQNQEYQLRLQELERKLALLLPGSGGGREGSASTSPSPPRVLSGAATSEETPTRAPSKATTETTYTRV